MKIFRTKDQISNLAESESLQAMSVVEETKATEISTINDLETVGKTSNEIKQQSVPKSIFFWCEKYSCFGRE